VLAKTAVAKEPNKKEIFFHEMGAERTMKNQMKGVASEKISLLTEVWLLTNSLGTFPQFTMEEIIYETVNSPMTDKSQSPRKFFFTVKNQANRERIIKSFAMWFEKGIEMEKKNRNIK